MGCSHDTERTIEIAFQAPQVDHAAKRNADVWSASTQPANHRNGAARLGI